MRRPVLSLRRRVLSAGREMSLGEFLAAWRLDPSSSLVAGLKSRGWAGGGDVERIELCTFTPAPWPSSSCVDCGADMGRVSDRVVLLSCEACA
jgi:hypothetical protein